MTLPLCPSHSNQPNQIFSFMYLLWQDSFNFSILKQNSNNPDCCHFLIPSNSAVSGLPGSSVSTITKHPVRFCFPFISKLFISTIQRKWFRIKFLLLGPAPVPPTHPPHPHPLQLQPHSPNHSSSSAAGVIELMEGC